MWADFTDSEHRLVGTEDAWLFVTLQETSDGGNRGRDAGNSKWPEPDYAEAWMGEYKCEMEWIFKPGISKRGLKNNMKEVFYELLEKI